MMLLLLLQVQHGEAWKEAGAAAPRLQGGHQVPAAHAEARLHWRV